MQPAHPRRNRHHIEQLGRLVHEFVLGGVEKPAPSEGEGIPLLANVLLGRRTWNIGKLPGITERLGLLLRVFLVVFFNGCFKVANAFA